MSRVKLSPVVHELPFAGSAFAKTGAGNQFKDYTAALGFNYTISPSIVNELRGGFLYVGNFFAYNGINHFLHQKSMSQYAEAKGVPAAESATPATGAMLLAGGASIMAGLGAQLP